MNGFELRRRIADRLLDTIEDDRFPSVTMMDRVEGVIGGDAEAMSHYADVLLDKVEEARFPSIEMLNRLDRIAEQLG